MKNELPTWLLISIGLVPFLFFCFLLVWLASTGPLKYEESRKAGYPARTPQPDFSYESLSEKHNKKIESIRSYETLLQEQKNKELNQTRLDIKDQLQLLRTQKELSKI